MIGGLWLAPFNPASSEHMSGSLCYLRMLQHTWNTRSLQNEILRCSYNQVISSSHAEVESNPQVYSHVARNDNARIGKFKSDDKGISRADRKKCHTIKHDKFVNIDSLSGTSFEAHACHILEREAGTLMAEIQVHVTACHPVFGTRVGSCRSGVHLWYGQEVSEGRDTGVNLPCLSGHLNSG